MPEVVETFVKEKNCCNIFPRQAKIYKHYLNSISNNVFDLNKLRISKYFSNIAKFVTSKNRKFQTTKIDKNARLREYEGYEKDFDESGLINVVYKVEEIEPPLINSKVFNNFRFYYSDITLLMGSLKDKDKREFLGNRSFLMFNGSFLESYISEALMKSGYKELFFYLSKDSTEEFDFLIQVKNKVVPINVKPKKGQKKKLKVVMNNKNLSFVIQFSRDNIGFNGKIFTFPYSLSFLLRRFFNETNYIDW